MLQLKLSMRVMLKIVQKKKHELILFLKDMRGRMSRRIFELISNFARVHNVEIEFKFDCIGRLTITMIRDEYEIHRQMSRSELYWVEDCNIAILTQLYSMLQDINENKPI
jgi:hypothetical protein